MCGLPVGMGERARRCSGQEGPLCGGVPSLRVFGSGVRALYPSPPIRVENFLGFLIINKAHKTLKQTWRRLWTLINVKVTFSLEPGFSIVPVTFLQSRNLKDPFKLPPSPMNRRWPHLRCNSQVSLQRRLWIKSATFCEVPRPFRCCKALSTAAGLHTTQSHPLLTSSSYLPLALIGRIRKSKWILMWNQASFVYKKQNIVF